jgi:hypothetical protein
MRFSATPLLLLGALLIPTLSTAQPQVLALYCEADEVNPFDPNGNEPGPYRPRAVTLRIDLGARTVEMRDRGELIASQTGVVVTDATYKWGTGSRGLDTWERQGLPRISKFDGTIDRIAGHAVVQWNLGPGGRWPTRGFAGKCRVAPAEPKF